MRLILRRKIYTEKQTIGKLYFDLQNGKGEQFFCDTLEDKYRGQEKEDKIFGKTCIPYGVYKCQNTFSQKFNKILPLIIGVNNFEGIRIHAGNTEKDTLGCVLVGTYNGKQLINSRIAFDKLFNTLKFYKNGYEIQIIND